MKFETLKIKDSNKWLIKNTRYLFKEDWILQAHKLGFKKYLDWVEFLDSNYGEKVSLTREYYICPENKTFEGPAGLKVFFNNIKDAQKYCEILNKGE